MNFLRNSEELHVNFKTINNFSNLLFSIWKAFIIRCILVPFIPVLILLLRQILLRDDESSKTFSGKILTFIKKETTLNLRHSTLHDRVSTFQVEHDTIRGNVSKNNAHALGFRCEREVRKNHEDFFFANRILNRDLLLVSLDEFHLKFFCNLH